MLYRSVVLPMDTAVVETALLRSRRSCIKNGRFRLWVGASRGLRGIPAGYVHGCLEPEDRGTRVCYYVLPYPVPLLGSLACFAGCVYAAIRCINGSGSWLTLLIFNLLLAVWALLPLFIGAETMQRFTDKLQRLSSAQHTSGEEDT